MGQDTYERQLDGLDITYEDYEPGFGTPHGVARTSELEIWAVDGTPTHEELATMARHIQDPPLLVCEPIHYQTSGVFGGAFTVGAPTGATELATEEQLAVYIDNDKRTIEKHSTYGFWVKGDRGKHTI